MKRLAVWLFILTTVALAVSSVQPGQAQTGQALTGKQVILAGTIQAALGGKAWDPGGEITRMTEVSSNLYEFVAAFPKGNYEYKVAVGGSWDENYGRGGEKGGGNIPLNVNTDGTIVKFVFAYEKKEIADSVNNADQVKAPETVPVAAAAPVAQPASAQVSGTTRLTLHYKRARGDYDGWNLWAWGAAPQGTDGRAYPFTGKDDFGSLAVLEIPGVHSKLGFIVRKGDWEAKDGDTDRFVDVQDGKAEIWVFQGQKDFYTSKADVDAYLAKAAPPRGEPAFLDRGDTIRAWWPKPVDPSSLTGKLKFTVGGQAVKIKAITAAGPVVGAGSSDSSDPTKVVFAGTIQGALGGSDWNPNGDISRATQVSAGVYEFVAAFPKGSYEYKVARGGSWAENYGVGFEPGGANVALSVPTDGTVVRFVVDFNAKTIKDSLNNPAEVKAPASAPPRAAVKPVGGPVQVVNLQLERPLTAREITLPMELKPDGDLDRTVYARDFLDDPQFHYSGDDLGSRWSAKSTAFKVWSPVATSVELFLFDNAADGPTDILDMKRGSAGVWYFSAPGDLHGKYYQYRLKSYGETRVAADINAYAAGGDSKRSVVVNLAKTNPQGWSIPKGQSRPQTDSIIYEMHVRDFTTAPSSGVKPEWRGKYLGLTQTGTRLPGGTQKTGLDYLTDLGVTDIHLLPIQNFNPANSGVYNWGYETTLFNVPEEQYATLPDQPLETIRQTKMMIAALHNANLRVIMDVVYNHTVPAGGEDSAFWQTVPYFYFRTNDEGQLLNESGVGNAVQDERPMVRKYIRDSTAFWLKEYGIDGYRFDLVGMFTKGTVQNLTQTLRQIRPDVVLYGEPWTGGGPTRFGKGTQRSTGFAVFNDNIRNVMRGDLDGTKAGFVMGGLSSTTQLQKGIIGSITDFTDQPVETVNYISAHDNLTLWDKLEKAMPDASQDLRSKAAQLAGAIVLTSQGVPFLEGGVEIGRTKGGNNNSYNAGDSANRFDWDRATQFQGVHDYYKGLIAIRKAHRAFRLWDARDIREILQFLPDNALPQSTVAYTLNGAKVGDAWKRILVVLHGSKSGDSMTLPAGTWQIAANANKASPSSLGVASGTLKLEPLSAYILYQ